MQSSAFTWLTRADDRVLQAFPQVQPHLPRLRAALEQHERVALRPLLRCGERTREGVETALVGRFAVSIDTWFELVHLLRDALQGAWAEFARSVDPDAVAGQAREHLAHRVDPDALDSFGLGLRVSIGTARWATGREAEIDARLALPGVDVTSIVRLAVLRDVAIGAVLLGADDPASSPQDETVEQLCWISKDLSLALAAVLRTVGGAVRPEDGARRAADARGDGERDWLSVSRLAFDRLLATGG
jgi:hypothetical protein